MRMYAHVCLCLFPSVVVGVAVASTKKAPIVPVKRSAARKGPEFLLTTHIEPEYMGSCVKSGRRQNQPLTKQGYFEGRGLSI